MDKNVAELGCCGQRSARNNLIPQLVPPFPPGRGRRSNRCKAAVRQGGDGR